MDMNKYLYLKDEPIPRNPTDPSPPEVPPSRPDPAPEPHPPGNPEPMPPPLPIEPQMD